MKMIKFLIFILGFSIIFLIECSKSNLTDDQIKGLTFNSDKSSKSIFDKVQWIKIKEKNGITLYMQKNKNEKINSYKAEKILNSSNGEKLFKNLMDFDKYSKIFPRTIAYKKIKDISKNKYLMYCQADFKPFKNRDYYEIYEYSVENKNNIKEWAIEWSPLGSYPEKFPDKKGFVRVKVIYGRWKIIELDDKVKISVEYYNNYNLPVSKALSAPFEKSSTIEALNKIINYTN
jgi:hypothetical protein